MADWFEENKPGKANDDWFAANAPPPDTAPTDVGWGLKAGHGPRRAFGVELPSWTEPLFRVGGSIVGDMKGDTAIGRALGMSTEVNPNNERAPILNFSNLGAEDLFAPIKDTTTGKVLRGATKGAQEFATGLTTPENALLMAGTGGLGIVAGKLGQTAVAKALSAAFGVDMVYKALEQTPAFASAVAAGDTEKATNILTQIVGGSVMGATAVKHAAKGGGGRVDTERLPSVKESEKGSKAIKSSRSALVDKWVEEQKDLSSEPATEAAPMIPDKPQPSIDLLLRRKQQEKLASQLGLAYPKPKRTGLEQTISAEVGPVASTIPSNLTRAEFTVPTVDPVKGAGFIPREDLRPPIQPTQESPFANAVLPNRLRADFQPPTIPRGSNVTREMLPESLRTPYVDPAAPSTPGQPLTPRQVDAFEAFTSKQPVLPRDAAELYSPSATAEALAAAESINRPIDIRVTTTPITRTPKSAETSLDVQTNPSQVKGESIKGMTERREMMDNRLKKAVMRGDKTAIQNIIESMEKGDLSSLGGAALDKAANRAWSWTKGKFSPGIETPIADKPNFLQQSAADQAARLAEAKKGDSSVFGLTPPDTLSSPWQRGMWRINRLAHAGGVYFDDRFRGTEQTNKQSIKQGERYKDDQFISGRLEDATNAQAIAAEKLTQIGFNKWSDDLTARGGHEASEYTNAPHFKTLEIRGAGNRLFEEALSDKTSKYYDEANTLSKAYNQARSELVKLDEATTDPAEYEAAVEKYHESRAAMDQWKIDHGQSFWQTLLESGEKGPRTGRTAVEIEGYMTDPQFKVYEPYRKIIRDGYEMVEKEAVDSGLISQKLLDRMKELYPDYVHISRITQDGLYSGGAIMGTRSVGHLPAQTGFKKFKTDQSDLAIEDASTSLYNKAMGTISESMRNRVGNQLAEFLTTPGADGKMGRLGWRDVMRLVPPEEIKGGKFKPSPENSIAFLENGRKRYIEISDPLITRGLRNINPTQVDNLALQLVKQSARVFRFGQTGVNLEFASRNIPVDISHSIHTSPVKFRNQLMSFLNPKTFYDTVKQTVLGEGPDRSAMTMKGSGFNENILYQSPEAFSASMSHVFTKPGRFIGEVAELPSKLVNKPIETLAAAPGTALKGTVQAVRVIEKALIKSEEFSRLRAFKSVKSEIMKPNGANNKFFGMGKSLAERYGIDPELVAKGLDENTANRIAALEANNILPPYHRSGLWMKVLSPMMPYLNASQKATTSTLRRLADNPAKFATAWTITVGIPTIAATAWNLQDERMAKLHFKLAEFEKKRSTIRLLPLPNDGETYEEYTRRVTKDNDRFSTFNLPLVPGIIGETQIALRRGIEEAYRQMPTETVQFTNSILGLDPPTTSGTPVDKPLMRPFTAAEVMERASGSVLPFEPTAVLASVTPPIAKGVLENKFGKDFYTGRPIVANNLERLEGVPERQFSTGRQTSPLMADAAAFLGPKIGIPTLAPQHLENIIFKQFGTFGRHALNIADTIAGYPKSQRGGRDVTEGIKDLFFSSMGGEDERIEAEKKGNDKISSNRTLYLNIGQPELQFSMKAGYTPSLPTRKTREAEVLVNGKKSKRTTYEENPDLYAARLKLRGLAITKSFNEVLNAVDAKKWKAVAKETKQDILKKRVSLIDDAINSIYTDDLTDAERLQLLTAKIAEFENK